MVESMRHESNYETGTWIDESSGVYIGWVVRKGAFADGMPLQNERGDVLVFSGEEYSDPGTVARLKAAGHEVEGDGASYLVHLYETEPSFPACLNGRFHGVLFDRNLRSVTLFNDRYGIHRLYYHRAKGAFYFAAEAKAILAVRPELRVANNESLGEFVSFGCVVNNKTLFQDVFVLPPASKWTFRNGEVEKGAYFRAEEWEGQEPLDGESYYQALRDVFAQNLPRYFAGREKVGFSLTGGLDTRMIMAWHRAPANSLPCYTFGGPFHESEDVRVARKVARACQQPFEVFGVGKDFLAKFPEYAERTVYLSDGCAPIKHAADLYVNELAKQVAPVRMTGNYGSEVLRRLPSFKPVKPPSDLFCSEFLASVGRAESTYRGLAQGHAVSFIAFRQLPWHHFGLLGLEQTQVSLRSPFLDNEVVRVAFRAPGASAIKTDIFADDDHCVRLIADGSSTLRNIRTDRGLAGPPGRFASAVVRGWMEFTFKAEYAYDYGMPQWVAKIDHSISALHLERVFLGRHKFVHFRVWYRDELSAYVREILLDSRTLSRPYLNRQGVEAVVKGHLTDGRNYTTQIHQLLSLELVHRLWLDPQ